MLLEGLESHKQREANKPSRYACGNTVPSYSPLCWHIVFAWCVGLKVSRDSFLFRALLLEFSSSWTQIMVWANSPQEEKRLSWVLSVRLHFCKSLQFWDGWGEAIDGPLPSKSRMCIDTEMLSCGLVDMFTHASNDCRDNRNWMWQT